VRLIITGCEYAGKTTLANALKAWEADHGFHFHMDDHFTIPDGTLRTDEEREAAVNAPPMIKERFQRFQIYYHLNLLHKYRDIILVGFHIEEAVYGPRYYYPGRRLPNDYHRQVETEAPRDTILVALSARPEVIRARMAATPHRYQVVAAEDVEGVLQAFDQEFAASWFKHKFRIDTSELAPEQLLAVFLRNVRSFLNERDLLLFQLHGV
jgi:thymidylate kinase